VRRSAGFNGRGDCEPGFCRGGDGGDVVVSAPREVRRPIGIYGNSIAAGTPEAAPSSNLGCFRDGAPARLPLRQACYAIG